MTKAVSVINQGEWTPDQLKLITDTVARSATPDELSLFLYRCKILSLDPLKPGQIHFVKYGTGPGTIVIGIEGFRTAAARTKKISGVKRGVIKDDKGNLIAGWAEVCRSDWTHPAREEVPFAEYNTGRGPWQKMPETMIKKVAEAAALRMAFPDFLGGIYVEEEMDKQKPVIGNQFVKPVQPEADDGVQSDEYFVPYGPLAKKPISQCDPVALREFILSREDQYKKSGKPHGAWFIELLKHAEPYIAAYENGVEE